MTGIRHPWTRLLPLLGLLLATAWLGRSPARAESNAADYLPVWSTPVALSGVNSTPKLPVLAGNSSGSRLLAVYADGDNVVYRQSTNQGASWQAAQNIVNSLAESVQPDVTFGSDGRAHAVWIEGISLVYAADNNWPASPAKVISDPALPPGAANPVIAATGATVLDVIWTEGSLVNPSLKHARSVDGGASWTTTPSTIFDSVPASLSPALAVDRYNPNRLYAVWEEHDQGTPGTIYFAQGTVSGNTSTWSAPAKISASGASDDRQPEILMVGNQLRVVYTHLVGDAQFLYYVQCAAGCTSAAGWSAPINVSGEAVGANATDPFDVISALHFFRGCTWTYFHGTDDDYPQGLEGVWGASSCDGWGTTTRDLATDPTSYRAINPQLASTGNDWLYLVYEKVDISGRQVMFQRGQITTWQVVLPAIFRPQGRLMSE